MNSKLEFSEQTDCCYLASLDGLYEIEHNDYTDHWDSFYAGDFIGQSISLATAKETCRYHFKNNKER